MKERLASRFDGSAYRTMLRNDAYWFPRLGIYHRARRQHRPHPRRQVSRAAAGDRGSVGGGLDYFQWAAILRSVSALTAYHWVYRESLKPWLIADLLILNEQMPRSLASCYENLVRLSRRARRRAYGRQGRASARRARSRARLAERAASTRSSSKGLHEFLTEFIADNNRLGAAIAEQYLT